jgi:hypothetical protein
METRAFPTDDGQVGRSTHPGHRRAAIRRAVTFAAGAALVGAGLSACGRSVSAEPTVIEQADHAVVHTGGTALVAHPGLRLHRGDVVTVQRGGSVALRTAGRRVYVLGGQDGAALAVVDGARQQLRQGTAVVDARRGPGVMLAASGFTVRVADGAAVRVERGFTVRVATFSGHATGVRSAAGRSLVVPQWYQVVSGSDALPAEPTPLRLLDDPVEQVVARGLVTEDEELNAEARGLDGSGPHAATAVLAAFRPGIVQPVPGAAPSESVLPLAIAKATGRALAPTYRQVLSLRSQGGSWAVVARIAGADADRAVRALAALQSSGSTPSGQGLLALRRLAAEVAASAGPAGSTSGSAATGGGRATGTSGGSSSNGGSSPGGAGSGASPSPSPSGGIAGDVVSTVNSVLPTPVPSPSPVSSPTAGSDPGVLPIVPLPVPTLSTAPIGG